MGQRFGDVGRAFGACRLADGPDYWDDPDSRHLDHRRHVRNLLIASVVITLIGIVIHPTLLMLLVVGPFLLIETYQLRRSEPS